MTQAYLDKHKITAHIVELTGSVEVMISLGVADAIVDLVETGSTLAANRLIVLDELGRYEAVLVQNPATQHTDLADRVVRRLEGIVIARSYSLLEYNVPEAKLRGYHCEGPHHTRPAGALGPGGFRRSAVFLQRSGNGCTAGRSSFSSRATSASHRSPTADGGRPTELAMPANPPGSTAYPPASTLPGCRRCADAAGADPGAIVIAAFVFYLFSGRYVSTDNAYVGAQKVLITPEVSGKVVRIAVVEGQQLAPGDELFSIDPEPYRLAAQEAEARLARVKTDFDTLKSSGRVSRKQIELSRESVAANQADYDRKTSLLNNRISTPADLDKSRMALLAAKALLEQLQQQEATRAQSAARRSWTCRSSDIRSTWRPPSRSQRAKRDLANTVLRAPIAGIATQVTSIQMGRYLTAGMAVFSIIGTDACGWRPTPRRPTSPTCAPASR